MKAVILQPMYLPWIGYFGMMQQADVFVFHDDIEFVRQSWQRRNRIKVPEQNGEIQWLTVPVEKDQGQTINEVEIKDNIDWQKEHWNDIKKAYSDDPVPYGSEHAQYFEKYEDLIRGFYDQDWELLENLTTHTVMHLAEQIGIGETKILSTSSDLTVDGTKTTRVINILEAVGADEYISGLGAKNYLDVQEFENNDISLYWHEFEHPEYPQPYGDFQSHMSAIDFLFNVGPQAESILRQAETDSLVKAT